MADYSRGSWIAERDAADMQRKLLQENTKKLTALEIIAIIAKFNFSSQFSDINKRELIREIEKRYVE